MKKHYKIKIFIVLILVIGFIVFVVKKGKQGDQNSQSRLTRVEEVDLIQRVTIAGNITPKKKAIVTAPFNGHIKKLYVRMGQEVKKGDPLVSITQSLQSTDPVYPLRSPLNGTVVYIQKEEGEFVTQDNSEEFILRVDNLEELYVNASLPEIDISKVELGLKTVIKASAILNKKYDGEVISISLASKNQSSWNSSSKVEFPIKIKILNPDGDIKSGMSVIVDIETFRKNSVLALPHEFIFKENNQFFVLNREGEKQEVTIGAQNEFYFEIKSGLSLNDEVKQVDFIDIMSSK